MASNRHLGRMVALQSLYEYEFQMEIVKKANLKKIVERNLLRYKDEIGDREFVKWLADGVMTNAEELDATLQPLAPDWPISQIARIDRAILRMGLFELTYGQEEVPPKVAINEAVELAKSFGSDNSSKFINGVLGAAYKRLTEQDQESNHESAGQI